MSSKFENTFTNILSNAAIELEEKSSAREFYEKLSEAGLNPRDYKADQHDYVPFLLQIAIDGEISEFADLIRGNEDKVASVFRVLRPDYIADLVSKFKSAYGLQAERLKTKILAIKYIAKTVSDEDIEAWVSAYEAYEAEHAKKVEDLKKVQAKLI